MDSKDDFSEYSMLEYSSLRSESIAAKGYQQTILQWCLAAVAAISVAGAGVVLSDKEIFLSASLNFYAGFAVFSVAVPFVVASAFGIWIGEVRRMERVGKFIRMREAAYMLELGISAASPLAASKLPIMWESFIFDDELQGQHGKNRIGSIFSTVLFFGLYYGSLGIAWLVSFEAAKLGIGSSGKHEFAALYLIAIAALFLAVFLPVLARLSKGSHGRVPSPIDIQLPKRASVDLVLPCLNEAEAAPWVFSRIPQGVSTYVSDNGSTDSSIALARSMNFEVISAAGRGVGVASNAGILAGTGDIVCVMDLDASVDPVSIIDLITPILTGEADYVIGQRKYQRGSTSPSHRLAVLVRRLLMKGVFSGLRLNDIGSARAFRRDLISKPMLERLDSHGGWSLDLTLSLYEQLGHTRLREIEIPHYPRIGRSKVTGTLRGFIYAAISSVRVVLDHARTRQDRPT